MPETIGSYKVIRELGKGSVGAVYLVKQENLQRELAIKMLFPEFCRDSEFVERFRREGQIAARLRHPHIVQIYDFSDRDGLFYIAMEYLGPRNLKDVIYNAGGKLPQELAIRFTDQLLSALEHAHSLGVVHRDIKPANVLVTDRNEAALTDFSIAQMASTARLTQTGVMMGTPEYMSPEQFDAKNVDGRCDLYATGLILYEMLTGDHPFAVGSVPQVLKAQLFKIPTAPHLVDPAISEALSAVIMKSLEKSASDRYASAAEMRQALLAACAGNLGSAVSSIPSAPAAVHAPLLDLPPTVGIATDDASSPKVILGGKDAGPTQVKEISPPSPPFVMPEENSTVSFMDDVPTSETIRVESPLEGRRAPAELPTLVIEDPSSSKKFPVLKVGAVTLLLVAGLAAGATVFGKQEVIPTPVAVRLTPSPEVSLSPTPSPSAPTSTPLVKQASPTPKAIQIHSVAIDAVSGAKISLDDKDTGKKTTAPTTQLQLSQKIPPGKHTITLTKEGFKSASGAFELIAGESLAHISLHMQAVPRPVYHPPVRPVYHPPVYRPPVHSAHRNPYQD